MIYAVIIDVDGVAVRRDRRFSDRLEADYGISTETTAPFFETVFPKCLVGKADLRDELALFYKNWGWRGTLDELLHYWFSKEGVRDEEVLRMAVRLKTNGIRVFLATDNEKYRTSYLVNEFGLEKYADLIFSSADIGFRKESKDFWERVASTSALLPKDILVWDDETQNIRAARNAGFVTELFIGLPDFKRKLRTYFPSIV